MPDFTTSEAAEILVTLRTSLMRIFIVIAAVWGVSFLFIADGLINKIRHDLLPEGANIIYITPLEGMILKLKISLIFGFVAVLPYILRLAYRTLQERTDIMINVDFRRGSAIKYAITSAILFSAGLVYGYFILQYFLQYLYSMAANQGVLAYYTISEFINFIVLMLAIFGVIFQMPLIMTFLVGYNLVRYKTLTFYRRHLYVVFFVLGSAITPPDVFTQLIVAFPMIIFFEISILVIRIIHRKKIETQKYLD